jgi:DnaJ family protein C protein 2
MLDLADRRWRATAQEIKDAYKRVSLRCVRSGAALLRRMRTAADPRACTCSVDRLHPDKCGIGNASLEERDRIEARFKYIQDAFEVLSDVPKRRMHDSTDEAEPNLPDALAAGVDFFDAFGPGFSGLARFSERQPVPELGSAGSAFSAVDSFYDFWFAFKSWREFQHEDEEDVEVADCREQKREMERKNAKLRERAKKDETARISRFVQVAYDADPRIRAAAAAAKAAKEAKKNERGAARRAEEEAKAAAEKAAADAKAAAEAAAAAERDSSKKNKEAARKALQKEKKRLRTAAEPAVASGRLAAGLADVETLCSELALEPLAELATAMEGASGGGEAALAAQVELLTVAMCKLSANYREAAAKAAAKAVARPANGASAAAPASAAPSKAWSEAEVKALDKAVKQFPVGTAKRWEAVATAVGTGRSADDVAAFAKARGAIGGGAAPGGDDYARFLAARKGSGDVADAASTRDTSFTDVSVNGGGDDAWTAAQDAALAVALKANPKAEGGDDKARWTKIAAAVDGKSAALCVKRVAALKELAKKA